MPGSGRSWAAPGGTQARRPCNQQRLCPQQQGTVPQHRSRAGVVTMSSPTNSPEEDEVMIRVQGPSEPNQEQQELRLVTNYFVPCSLLPRGCHQPHLLPPELQLTHNNLAKDLLLLSFLAQVTSSAPVFSHAVEGKCVYGHARAWIQSTESGRCLHQLPVDLNKAPVVQTSGLRSHGVHWNGVCHAFQKQKLKRTGLALAQYADIFQ